MALPGCSTAYVKYSLCVLLSGCSTAWVYYNLGGASEGSLALVGPAPNVHQEEEEEVSQLTHL